MADHYPECGSLLDEKYDREDDPPGAAGGTAFFCPNCDYSAFQKDPDSSVSKPEEPDNSQEGLASQMSQIIDLFMELSLGGQKRCLQAMQQGIELDSPDRQ